jgi:hypothetical protein
MRPDVFEPDARRTEGCRRLRDFGSRLRGHDRRDEEHGGSSREPSGKGSGSESSHHPRPTGIQAGESSTRRPESSTRCRRYGRSIGTGPPVASPNLQCSCNASRALSGWPPSRAGAREPFIQGSGVLAEVRATPDRTLTNRTFVRYAGLASFPRGQGGSHGGWPAAARWTGRPGAWTTSLARWVERGCAECAEPQDVAMRTTVGPLDLVVEG